MPYKEPLITGLVCGKWPVMMWHTMGRRHPDLNTHHDSFHWKCYIPKINQIEKLRFLGIARYRFELRFGYHLNLYRGLWVSRSGGFWWWGVFSGNSSCTKDETHPVESTENAAPPKSTRSRNSQSLVQILCHIIKDETLLVECTENATPPKYARSRKSQS